MFRYDAAKVCELLGIPNNCTSPAPEVELTPGEVLLWFPGITLTELRNSPIGMERMKQENLWYDEKGFTAPPGYYLLQLRVPNSNNKDWKNQLRCRPSKSAVAPVTVAAMALALHLKETGNDLLQNDWCRCVEEAARGCRAGLAVGYGRVVVNDSWDIDRGRHLWLAGAQN